MKKVLDQTVRDLKREVNKKVLKVPSIEQKTLDATSNEPWGPQGSVLAEIAQATFNLHDYQLIMVVLWKRMQDTGKNWRHAYKALSVLEFLAIHGSERVMDDVREHAYQISILSNFLYTDSNGRDQGLNVRRKSQNLVALLNNKGRLQEVRHKLLSSKEKSCGDRDDVIFQDERMDAPPSYEESTNAYYSDVQNGRDIASSSQKEATSGVVDEDSCKSGAGESTKAHEEVTSFDDFDPQTSVIVATSNGSSCDIELDIFRDSSAPMLINSPAKSHIVLTQNKENPFGDFPFKATNKEDFPSILPSILDISGDILDGILPWEVHPAADSSFQQSQPSDQSLCPPSHNSSEFCPSNPFACQSFQTLEMVMPQMNSIKNSQSIQLDPSQEALKANPLTSLYPMPSQEMQSVSLQSAHLDHSQEALKANPLTSLHPMSSQEMQSFSLHPAQPDPTFTSQLSAKPQPSDSKFQPKSAIWADTISRGLVNLNLSGVKVNPLADIGIDFDDINRKERRYEARSSQTPLPFTSSMGKAMGAGSGLGLAGANSLAQPLHSTNGATMGMTLSGGSMGITHERHLSPLRMPQPGHTFPVIQDPINGGKGFEKSPYRSLS